MRQCVVSVVQSLQDAINIPKGSHVSNFTGLFTLVKKLYGRLFGTYLTKDNKIETEKK